MVFRNIEINYDVCWRRVNDSFPSTKKLMSVLLPRHWFCFAHTHSPTREESVSRITSITVHSPDVVEMVAQNYDDECTLHIPYRAQKLSFRIISTNLRCTGDLHSHNRGIFWPTSTTEISILGKRSWLEADVLLSVVGHNHSDITNDPWRRPGRELYSMNGWLGARCPGRGVTLRTGVVWRPAIPLYGLVSSVEVESWGWESWGGILYRVFTVDPTQRPV